MYKPKDETFIELEPELDRGGTVGDGGNIGGNMFMWVFFFSKIMEKNNVLKVLTSDFRVKMLMSTTNL